MIVLISFKLQQKITRSAEERKNKSELTFLADSMKTHMNLLNSSYDPAVILQIKKCRLRGLLCPRGPTAGNGQSSYSNPCFSDYKPIFL